MAGSPLDFYVNAAADTMAEFDKYELLATRELEPRAKSIYKRAQVTRYDQLRQLDDAVIASGLDLNEFKKILGLSNDYLHLYKQRAYAIE